MKKSIYFIFLVLAFFGLTNVVNATETVTLTGTGITVDGQAAYKHYARTDGAHIAGGQAVLITVDSKPAYCIDFGKQFSSGTINDERKNLRDYVSSDEIYNRLSLIAYYGYGYDNHNTTKYYLAAQKMVWKTLSYQWNNIDLTDFDYYTSNSVYQGGTKIDISSEVNEIESLIADHNKKPSFCGNTVEVKVGEQKELTDSNGVLSKFSVNETGSNITVTANGNKLVITGVTKSNGNEITFNKAGTEGTSYVYEGISYDNTRYQDIYLGNYVPSVSCKITVNVKEKTEEVKTGKINVIKVDKDNNKIRIAGVVFEIHDENNKLVETITTDKNGEASVTLPIGNYTIKETKTNSKYILNDKIVTVVLQEDDIKNITFENEKINIEDNPKTSGVLIYIAWIVGFAALCFAIFYFAPTTKNVTK